MKHGLVRRIERLERRPVSPQVFLVARKRYEEDGELPRDRRVAALVQKIAAAIVRAHLMTRRECASYAAEVQRNPFLADLRAEV